MPRTKYTTGVVPALCAALALAACGGGRADAPRSAVLITLDTVRADALTCYGGRPGITPHLDALAAEGLRYLRAYTVTPLTLPAHASMLTGLYPVRHGLRNNGAWSLAPEADTLAEEARDRGVQTAAFLASAVLDGTFGLDQGFETYDSPRHALVQTTTHYPDRTAEEVVEAAVAWLHARDATRPFFLWVHLWDAHGPWEPPPELLSLSPDHPYLGDVAWADRGVGRLLDALRTDGALDETVVLAVGDHGEAFWEHDEFSHGAYCYEQTMRVPLILRDPSGLRAGETTDEIVSVADVLPTLAEAMGLSVPGDIDGRNLFRSIVPPDRGVYVESYYGFLVYGWSPLTGWIDSRGKYLFSPEPQFFDIAVDPLERTNLMAKRSEDVDRHRRAILELASRPRLERALGATNVALRERIGELGYGASPTDAVLPEPLAESDRPSPASQAAERRAVLQALEHFNLGRYREADEIHREILRDNPMNLHSLERLGICLIRQRRHAEAIPFLERAMASPHASAGAAVNLGTCYRKAGQLDRAIHWFERALAIDGSQVRAVRHLVDLHRAGDDREAAAAYARRYEDLTGEPVDG